MRMINTIILFAALLLAISVRAGNLTVDNLTVSKDATIYGKLSLSVAPTNPAVFTNGLAGCWPFNGNVNDVSGNNNHGVINGNVTLTADRFNAPNSAYQFNGNGYIRVSNSSSLCIPKDVSVSVWIKTANQWHGGWGNIVLKGNKHDRNYELAIDHGDRITWSDVTHGKKNWRITGKKGVSDGKWHHIVGTWDGQTVKLYVDGVCEKKEQCSSSRVPNNEPLFIGCDEKKDFFNGVIDDLQIYNRALSKSEVFSLYNYSH
ncbi:MAG: LamG domain-containing protein [Kiritimatiellia bacterium]|nr:LamG domain-containing protein [Kiritimatiellia bacterium]